VIVALSGGIGGAKLALGLSHLLDPARLLIVANTGDDFEHLGLSISPDIDTLLYTLAGLDNPDLGWGRRDESWACMETLEALGGETWFRLGDRDLALHLARTARLRAGESLSAVTDAMRRRLGVGPRILPASDDPVRTRLATDQGELAFQDYFVRRGCAPKVRAIAFDGAAASRPAAEVVAAIAAAEAVVICPSNPFISIDPILAVPGLRAAIAATPAPVVAVSPLIGGRAVKGPTAKMMAELGLPVTARAVAEHYADLLDVFVADPADAAALAEVGARIVAAPTLMRSLPDKLALARAVLTAAGVAVAAANPVAGTAR
jgi:LPPG:FO 2-phospho-L-lactate transferase